MFLLMLVRCAFTVRQALWWLAVHENFLTSLPASLGQCTLLEVLEARRNNLRALPDSWGSLISLTTMVSCFNLRCCRSLPCC